MSKQEMARITELQRLDELHEMIWPAALRGSLEHIELVLAIMDRRAAIRGLYDPAGIEDGFLGSVEGIQRRIEALPP